MAIYEKSLGPEHPNVSISLGNLAELLATNGSAKPSRSIGARSPSMRKALAPIIPTSLSGSEASARLREETNRPADAEPLYRRASRHR